jgi:hypothetical protein
MPSRSNTFLPTPALQNCCAVMAASRNPTTALHVIVHESFD